MLSRKSRKFEKNQKKATDTSKQTDSLNKFKKQLYKLEEKPEGSQLPDLPHKNIGDLIQEKQGEKAACEKAFSDLLKRTKEIKKELKEVQKNKNLSREDLVKQQLTVIEKDSYLNDLMLKNISSIEEELGFLKHRRGFQREFKAKMYIAEDLSRTSEQENWAGIFHYAGRNIDTVLKHPEPAKLATIESYNRLYSNHFVNDKATQQTSLAAKHQDTSGQLVITRYFNNPSIQEAKHIAERRDRKKILEENIQKIKHQQEYAATIFQNAKQKFKLVIQKDKEAISLACKETLQAYHQDKNSLSALQILCKAYLEQLKCLQNSQQLSKDEIERTLEEFQTKWNEQEAQMQSKIQPLKEQLKELPAPVKDEDKILKEAADAIASLCNTYNRTTGEYIANAKQLTSFYDFIEKNITRRPSNSLDELEKKSREALRLLENEIKELESLQRSEQSAQPQTGMEKLLPEDKLQKDLATSLENANMTDQRKYIVTSYMRGLFEKSDHQSLDKETIAKFCKENIEEAKQVEAYLEQKHFIHNKIRDEAIKLAVHLKHEFGIPIHHASIDADFNIVRSQKSSAITFKLEINPQGKILKDNRVQRVYLIGFQDPPETSSNHADAKPMALLAIQSGNTGYSKFGAGTPLPTGGVVDVVTAQHTRQDQRNLYKATLSLETLQETHDQKEIDIPTLEFFETETVKNYHTKAALYDVTTFAGKVKDRPNQAPADTSKQEKAYQETTGPCMIDLDELTSAVKQELGLPDRFRPSPIVMESIKRQIAKQTLGEEKVPTSDEGWKTNGQRCWADYEYSTSMNMFAKYLAVAYREKLGLARSK